MRIRNPLAASVHVEQLTRFARLYVLTRDAYYSDPATCEVKLDALDALRLDSLSALPAASILDAPRGTSGVRLVERLRGVLGTLGAEEPAHTRRRIVLDCLFSAAPPGGTGWARHPEPLVADVAGIFGLNTSSAELSRLVRGHRSAQRALWHTTRHSGASTVGRTAGDPHEALADALGSAMCVRVEVSLSAAVSLVRNTGADPHRAVAGGAILERLDLGQGPVIDKFVGTALARTSLAALVHHLATLEIAAVDDLDARSGIPPLLRSMRADMLSAQARDDEENRTLTAAACLVETSRERIEQRPRPRLGSLVTEHIRNAVTPEPDYRL